VELTDNYIAAAKNANKSPTALMRVVDASGQETFYTTESDWNGSDTLTNIRTAPETPASSYGDGDQLGSTGDAWHKAENGWTTITGGGSAYVQTTAAFDAYLNEILLTISTSNPPTIIGVFRTRIRVTDSLSTPTETYYSQEEIVDYQTTAGLGAGLFDFRISREILNTEVWYLIAEIFVSGAWQDAVFTVYNGTIDSLRVVRETGQLITSEIDVGSILTVSPILSLSDTEESGSNISYSYSYSDDDISYTSGGSTSDGEALTASRYYKITADFSTTNGGRGLLKEIIITEGVFFDIGTHKNLPINGVNPHLTKNSISKLTQRIDLNRGITTTGEMTVQMFWSREVSDMVATGFLKGKDVSIYAGFVELDFIDYVPIMIGTWYDHAFDEDNRTITVKIRDILKQFEKRKIPEESYDASGNKTSSPVTYEVKNIIDTITDIYDLVGIRSRYISDDYTTLEATEYSGADWNISREITQPKEAWKLLDELAQTGGLWLIPQGDGKIKPKVYNPSEAADPNLAIGDGVGDFGQVSGNLREFFSRYYAHYNPKTSLTSDPSQSTDFDNGTALVNATAELNWFPEKGQKDHLDLWKIGREAVSTPLISPPFALRKLTRRWDSFFTEPGFSTKVTKLPPRFAAVEVGDVIPVSGLLLPVPSDEWDNTETYSKGASIVYSGRVYKSRVDSNLNNTPSSPSSFWVDVAILDTGLTDAKRFLVTGRTFDPNTAQISLDILSMPDDTLAGGYASIKVVDGSTAQTAIGSSPVLMTGWVVNGDFEGIIPDHTTDKITVNADGNYSIEFQNSFTGSVGATWQFHLRVNGVERKAGCLRKTTASDVGSCSFTEELELFEDDEISVYVESDLSNKSMTPFDAQLTIYQVA
jgi:hypothetical protein